MDNNSGRPARPRPKGWQAAGVLVVAVIGISGLAGAASSHAGTSDARAGTGAILTSRHQAATAQRTNYTGTPAAPIPANSQLQRAASGNIASGKSASTADGTATQADLTAAAQTRIKETGSASLVVPKSDIGADVGKLTNMVADAGGFVSNSSTQSASAGSPAGATLTLKVPVNNFPTVQGQVRALGKVVYFDVTATDETGQYVDLQAQVTALQGTRQQYLTIMAKAKTVGGILAVENQLQSVDSQLQQLQGQRQQMSNQTTYASLTVTLLQKSAPRPVRRAASGLQKAWGSAVSGFVAGVEGVIRVAGPLLFAILLIGSLALGGRWALRFYRRPRSNLNA